MPPPTATSRSPARTAWSIIPTARTLDAQTLLIVSEVTSIGIPASICAWRDGICPWPACSTVPITTCSTCSGATSARSSASRIATPPRCVAGSVRQAPAQLADRRAGAAQDHGSRHAPSLLTCARMRVTATTDAPPATDADTIVVGVFEDEGIAHDHGGVLQALVDSGEAKRGLRKLAVTHAEGRRYIVAGLGARDEFDPERARVAAAGVVGRAQELGAKTLCWEVPAPRHRRARRRRWSRARCSPPTRTASTRATPTTTGLEALIALRPPRRQRAPRRYAATVAAGGQRRPRPAEPRRPTTLTPDGAGRARAARSRA